MVRHLTLLCFNQCLLPAVVIFLLVPLAAGQDDAGADMELQDMESMMGDTGETGKKEGKGKAADLPVLSQIEQTSRALQQLGIILC